MITTRHQKPKNTNTLMLIKGVLAWNKASRTTSSLVKAAHDVSGEARNKDGKWTDGKSKLKPGDAHPTMPHLAPSTQAQRDRVKELGGERPVPPTSWGVEVDESPDAKNTATFYDAKGRKQYVRSGKAASAANDKKFAKLPAMWGALPKVRKRVEEDITGAGTTVDRALAAIVRLMDTTTMRVGSEEYAVGNDTYGAASLRKKHVTLSTDGSWGVTFRFRGKDAVPWERTVKDEGLHKAVQAFKNAGNTEGDAKLWPVSEAHVNDYLAAFDLTAKNFRTYHATERARSSLLAFPATDDPKQRQKDVAQVVKSVSALLGNTPSVCKANYIHPNIIAKYLDGTLKEGDLN